MSIDVFVEIFAGFVTWIEKTVNILQWSVLTCESSIVIYLKVNVDDYVERVCATLYVDNIWNDHIMMKIYLENKRNVIGGCVIILQIAWSCGLIIQIYYMKRLYYKFMSSIKFQNEIIKIFLVSKDFHKLKIWFCLHRLLTTINQTLKEKCSKFW